jgi:hypothetical protein
METIRTVYLGDLRTQATHVKSGKQIITDVPSENGGKGDRFHLLTFSVRHWSAAWFLFWGV